MRFIGSWRCVVAVAPDTPSPALVCDTIATINGSVYVISIPVRVRPIVATEGYELYAVRYVDICYIHVIYNTELYTGEIAYLEDR